jgi:ABC-type transport system involved in multi-copper enzyme maturation permease subunit
MRSLAALLSRSVAQSSRMLLAVFTLLVGFQFLIVIQASSYERSQSFGRIAELMPGYLQRGLGNLALLLASFPGMVTAGYFHPVIVVMLALLAIYLAMEPAYEVESGLVDVVLARPVPRHQLVTRSLLLMVGSVLSAVLAMSAGTWAGLRLFADPSWDWPTVLTVVRLVAHLAAVAICMGALGLAVAAGAQRRATAFAMVAVLTVVAYLVAFLAISWAPAKPLAWLSPFYYYPAVSILAGSAPRLSNLLVLTGSAAVIHVVAYWRFARREL